MIRGALNNDMVGYTDDHRLDNTIRYSNGGIRDLQHAAALLFSDMTLYDARYYKNTDAHAYYEAYGDIVGGIGSSPAMIARACVKIHGLPMHPRATLTAATPVVPVSRAVASAGPDPSIWT